MSQSDISEGYECEQANARKLGTRPTQPDRTRADAPAHHGARAERGCDAHCAMIEAPRGHDSFRPLQRWELSSRRLSQDLARVPRQRVQRKRGAGRRRLGLDATDGAVNLQISRRSNRTVIAVLVHSEQRVIQRDGALFHLAHRPKLATGWPARVMTIVRRALLGQRGGEVSLRIGDIDGLAAHTQGAIPNRCCSARRQRSLHLYR